MEQQTVIKGEKVYYARVLIPVDVFDLCDLRVRTVGENWFSACEEKTHQAFIFNNKDLGTRVFKDRKEALKVVKDGQKNRIKVSKEVDYEKD